MTDNRRVGECSAILNSDDFIIFLDIDGVVNYCQIDYETLESQGIDVYNDMVSQSILPYHKIQLLNELCKEYNARVVISSTWRIGSSTEKLISMFEKCGATFKVIGITGYCCSGIRGVEINNWLHEHVKSYRRYNRYAILDDDSDMLLRQKDNFVQTNGHVGLLVEHCDKVRNIFNKK